jgi:hypothetical protein
MIKLTDLFEIMVTPRRVLIFKIPITLIAEEDYHFSTEIKYSDGVSISSQALLPDLNLYAKHPYLKFSKISVEIEEDTDEFDDVRGICYIPEMPSWDKSLPDGCHYEILGYKQRGSCYVSFKSAVNVGLNDIEGLVYLDFFDRKAFNTVQDAANYLLFKSN